MAVFGRLIGECLRSPIRLAALVTSLLVLSGTQLALTWLAKLWSDELLGGRELAALIGLLAAAALLTATMALALFVSRRLLAAVNLELVSSLREQAQSRLLAVETATLGKHARGDLVSRVLNDTSSVSGFAEAVLKRIVGEGFLLVGALGMMIYLAWPLTLVTFLVVLPLVAIVAPLSRMIRRRGLAAHAELGRLTALMAEQLQGLTTIKGFQAEDFERRRFEEQDQRFRSEALRSDTWAAALVGGVWLITGLGMLAILAYGSRLVIDGDLTSGGLLSFALYAIQTVEPLRRMSEVNAQLQRTVAVAGRVYEVIDFPWTEPDGELELPSPARGELRLENVSFAYEPGRPVLSGVSFALDPGETAALVSVSGGGKTTLARLLARFADPDPGRMRLDGIDLRDLRRASLRRAVSIVEQEPFVFAGSLADNVRYGSWNAPLEDVERAVELAALEPLAASLGGIDAPLQEGGRDLSGGQRQRISLARAIVRDPALLVLDEATSALDGDTEARIFDALAEWLSRRTVLVIAHRLSTVRRFERILVLEDGRLVGDGSVPSLCETCPEFARLFAEQLSSERGRVCLSRPSGETPDGQDEK